MPLILIFRQCNSEATSFKVSGYNSERKLQSRFTLICTKIFKKDRDQFQANFYILSRTKFYWVIEIQNVCCTFISSTNYPDAWTKCSVRPLIVLIEISDWDENNEISLEWEPENTSYYMLGERYHAPGWECLLEKSSLQSTELLTNVVCHCLLLMTGNMPYVGAKKTTQCSGKNHQPVFVLGQTCRCQHFCSTWLFCNCCQSTILAHLLFTM